MNAPIKLENTPAIPWTANELESRLRALESRYHIHHPFNRMLNGGRCSPAQIRGWVANRFYYQINIPLKDAAILSNCPDRATRRRWIQRLTDHDGQGGNEGGIEAWVRLGEAVGVDRDTMWSQRLVLPGVRFAVDAYVNFARRTTWQEGVCSSLTEMFAPQIHLDRLAGWPSHYPWIEPQGLQYFRSRVPLAQRDVEHGLEVTLSHFRTPAEQQRAVEILQFKLDILWSILDAVEKAWPI
ncbi:pyrroloquinoline quinone biosynthesis protein PqqC [Paraburkholderia guartelaensis]|uniref:Pyrroloquinoline-quinone synthase n=1 Tax=Paraburkholderia guartelaensis TaxID=2546446 RepID=A0A4V2ZUV3_9BURK|nr:pyrroloquinoline-quinone synthase PqqC [Paraburkholderia guartelaensis]TDG02581.1 pyrroloquinoline quinone biosynthesis protein PqqC [Paraburkholderia guartelaensis]